MSELQILGTPRGLPTGVSFGKPEPDSAARELLLFGHVFLFSRYRNRSQSVPGETGDRAGFVTTGDGGPGMADACTAFAMRGVEGRGSLRVWELRKTGEENRPCL